MAKSADSPPPSSPDSASSPAVSQPAHPGKSPAQAGDNPWDALPIAVWKLSPAGVLLEVNRASEEILGLDRGSIVGRPLDDFLSDSINFAFLKNTLAIHGKVAGLEAGVRRGDGSRRLAAIDASASLADGMLSAIHCTVSSRQPPKSPEPRGQDRMEFVLVNDEAVIILNLEGLVIHWSLGAERLYGLPPYEILGRPLPREFSVDAGLMERARREVLSRGEWKGEWRNTTATGIPFLAESRWVLLRDLTGKPQSILIINEDAAESRLLEEERLRAQRQQCIGNLAGGIAHDLNNILQPISIGLDIFRNRLPDHETQEVLAMLDSNVRRATELVRQILTFTSGVREERQTVEIGSLFNEVANFVRQAFPKAIQLQLSLEEGLPPVLGDQTQMEQVILNLCVNARDAMRGGGELRLDATRFEVDSGFAARQPLAKPGQYVRLSVSDTGPGIPLQIRKKIFDPFFTTKGPGKGTGLGLATVLGIIRRHGGFLTLETEEGRGSAFHVFIPAAPSTGKASSAPSAPHRESPENGGGETILLVDDESTVLKLFQRSLEKAGYRVLTANNGEEGREVFLNHPGEIRLVVTDMSMPGMDGPEMAAAIHRVSPSLPILGTSGLDTKPDQETLRLLGLKEIIGKPCSSKTILQAIRQILDAA